MFSKILKLTLTILIASNLIDQIAGGFEQQMENFVKIKKCLECFNDESLKGELEKLYVKKKTINPVTLRRVI